MTRQSEYGPLFFHVCSLLPLCLLAGLLPVGAGTPMARSSTSQERPEESKVLPFDPLTQEERAAAERTAQGDKRVKEMLGEGGVRVISVELLTMKPEKPPDEGRPVRHAEVILFRPGGDVGVRVAVNLEKGAVEDAKKLDSAQVPMNADDLAEAFEVAMKNEELLKALGPEAKNYRVQGRTGERTLVQQEYGVTGLRVRGTETSDPCFKDRCMQLFFRKGDVFLSQPSVIVNLTARKVSLERTKQ